jgi:hypothetical protein
MTWGNDFFGNVFGNVLPNESVTIFVTHRSIFYGNDMPQENIGHETHPHFQFANIAGEHYSQHTKPIADIIFALYSHN